MTIHAQRQLKQAQTGEPYTSLMRYKRWADEQLFDALLARPGIEQERSFELIREIVGHVHVVDCIFQAHLSGRTHAYADTKLHDFTTLLELKHRVAAVDDWYVDYTERVNSDALAELLPIRFTDGTLRKLTRSEVLLHISHHGAYHRGNVGVMIHSLGMKLPADRFTSFFEEARGE